jgi:hypothetical protein
VGAQRLGAAAWAAAPSRHVSIVKPAMSCRPHCGGPQPPAASHSPGSVLLAAALQPQAWGLVPCPLGHRVLCVGRGADMASKQAATNHQD